MAATPLIRLTALAAAAILIFAPAAAGQSAADQYVPQLRKGGPVPGDRVGGAGGANADVPGPTVEERVAKLGANELTDRGEGAGGSAPGSDFPLTPLVAILGGLLVLGLLARAMAPAASRAIEALRSR